LRNENVGGFFALISRASCPPKGGTEQHEIGLSSKIYFPRKGDKTKRKSPNKNLFGAHFRGTGGKS